MEYNFTVQNTVKRMTQFQTQLSHRVYPVWVTLLSYSLIFGSAAILTLGFYLLFYAGLVWLTPLGNPLIALIPAVLLAFHISTRLVTPRANKFFVRFAKFDVDLEYATHFQINQKGLVVNEGDRRTEMDWSAIGGVFQLKGFLVFYCRGLFYNVPSSHIGDSDAQDEMFQTCKTWQSNAQGHATAKAFI